MEHRVPEIMRSHHHGLAHRRELMRAGFTRADIDSAWRDGLVERVRHGLYALPGLPEPVLRAARVGGVLAGSSSLSLRGAWSPPVARLVLSVPHNARDLRHPDDSGRRLGLEHSDVLVLRDGASLTPSERLTVSPSRAAAQVLVHEDVDVAVAVVDSALRLPHPERPVLQTVARLLDGRPASALLALLDARAESGTESAARVRLVAQGLRPEVQVAVAPGIRVDLLLDGWLVVECTSYEFHGSPRQYEKDRTRIAALIALGYVVVEVSYHQVFEDWEAVWAAIARLLARGRPQNPTSGPAMRGNPVIRST
jgi:very-short-patch-repair endonuclease